MDQFYKYFRWLSLDIVLGAILFLWYLEDQYQLNLSLHVYFALGSAIWLIYTTDHLIDSQKVKAGVGDRHTFHYRYSKGIILTGGVILILALTNVFFLDEILIKSGALLSACCVGYLLLVFFIRRLWIKEILVAGAYASGIFLAPLVYSTFVWMDVLYVLELASVAFLNLIIFSSFDMHKDVRDGFNSIALRLGSVRTSLVVWIYSGVMVMCSISLFMITWESIQLLFLFMTLILLTVYAFPRYFSQFERFRIVGDGVFYLPFLFLLVCHLIE